MLPGLEVTLDTLLEIAILLAILVEIGLCWYQGWSQQKEARNWHEEARQWHVEEMAMWHLENGDDPEEKGKQ